MRNRLWKVNTQFDQLSVLRKALSGPDIDGSHYESVEWFVFTSAFILRKLCQSKRLSYEVERRDLWVKPQRSVWKRHRARNGVHRIQRGARAHAEDARTNGRDRRAARRADALHDTVDRCVLLRAVDPVAAPF